MRPLKPMQDLNLKLLQTPLLWHDPAGNRAVLEELIRKEADGSDLLLLPETFTTGYTMEAAQVAETMDGDTVGWMRRLASELKVDLCGSIIIADDGRHFNRLIWATADGDLRTYDKRHLFRMGGEHDRYTPGRERIIVRLGDWRICPMVCYDLRFPVWSRNRGDYDLLLYVANWPAARLSAWETLLPARAVENLSYSAGVNRTGTDGKGIENGGTSMVCDYLGRHLAIADKDPTTLRATLSLADLQRYREKFPAWKDADSFELNLDKAAH
ncbi:MAG: amidohydrolase [Gammaproteobacteria bacterium]|nr:amidohydrolase [Gammaproteobacteria bacterium]